MTSTIPAARHHHHHYTTTAAAALPPTTSDASYTGGDQDMEIVGTPMTTTTSRSAALAADPATPATAAMHSEAPHTRASPKRRSESNSSSGHAKLSRAAPPVLSRVFSAQSSLNEFEDALSESPRGGGGGAGLSSQTLRGPDFYRMDFVMKEVERKWAFLFQEKMKELIQVMESQADVITQLQQIERLEQEVEGLQKHFVKAQEENSSQLNYHIVRVLQDISNCNAKLSNIEKLQLPSRLADFDRQLQALAPDLHAFSELSKVTDSRVKQLTTDFAAVKEHVNALQVNHRSLETVLIELKSSFESHLRVSSAFTPAVPLPPPSASSSSCSQQTTAHLLLRSPRRIPPLLVLCGAVIALLVYTFTLPVLLSHSLSIALLLLVVFSIVSSSCGLLFSSTNKAEAAIEGMSSAATASAAAAAAAKPSGSEPPLRSAASIPYTASPVLGPNNGRGIGTRGIITPTQTHGGGGGIDGSPYTPTMTPPQQPQPSRQRTTPVLAPQPTTSSTSSSMSFAGVRPQNESQNRQERLKRLAEEHTFLKMSEEELREVESRGGGADVYYASLGTPPVTDPMMMSPIRLGPPAQQPPAAQPSNAPASSSRYSTAAWPMGHHQYPSNSAIGTRKNI